MPFDRKGGACSRPSFASFPPTALHPEHGPCLFQLPLLALGTASPSTTLVHPIPHTPLPHLWPLVIYNMPFNVENCQPSRDDQPCPLPQYVDPLSLVLQAIPCMNAQSATPSSATVGFVEPEGAPWLATYLGDVQPSPFFPDLPLPPPSESFPLHSDCPPYPDSLPQAQEDLSAHVVENAFLPTPPAAPIHSWTGFNDSDGALHSSPTHLEEPLPLPDIPLDAERWDRTGASNPSCSRSSVCQPFFGGAFGNSNTTIEVSQSAIGFHAPVRIITVNYHCNFPVTLDD